MPKPLYHSDSMQTNFHETTELFVIMLILHQWGPDYYTLIHFILHFSQSPWVHFFLHLFGTLSKPLLLLHFLLHFFCSSLHFWLHFGICFTTLLTTLYWHTLLHFWIHFSGSHPYWSTCHYTLLVQFLVHLGTCFTQLVFLPCYVWSVCD